MSKQQPTKNVLRFTIKAIMDDFVEGCKVHDNKLLQLLTKKFTNRDTSYGVAEPRDFRELAPIFANLFAYDNKHYYVYKAISDSNKLGFLSARQYLALKALMRRLNHLDTGSRHRQELIEQFLRNKGTMASPYKMLKRAFKENKERTKFLAGYFPLEEDKKTTRNEEYLIRFCDLIMRANTNIEIKPASVQECYDVNLSDDYSASGDRFATSSCMFGLKVGDFYEAFGAQGHIVYERGKPIGRFLLWNLPDGKQYVDRLYVQSHGHEDALAEIDKQFPNAIKYPALRRSDAPTYIIRIKNKNVFKEKLRVPYIDTFGYLRRKGTEYYLCNKEYADELGDKFIDSLHNTADCKHFTTCPHCNQLGWQGDPDMVSSKRHILMCSAYQPKQKRIQAMLKVYRDYVQKTEVANEQRALFEL